jgi:hypothetical protein
MDVFIYNYNKNDNFMVQLLYKDVMKRDYRFLNVGYLGTGYPKVSSQPPSNPLAD